jgi:hypothetical protein
VVGGDPTAIVGKGAFDLRRNLGQLRLTLPSERGSLDVVNVGNTYYVKGKQVSRLTQGRPWLGIDVASLPADQRQRLLGTSRLPAATDPKTEMVLLGGLTGEVVDLGPSTPDELGPVRGYRITADLRKLAPKLQPDQRQRFQKLGITQLPVEVFLDGFGYLRRIRYTLEPPRLVSGPGVGVTADFSGFGIPVRVTPPPTAKVTFLR